MSPQKAIVFAVLHHALFGPHLGSVFAPNHKGMEMPDGDTRWGHLEKQVRTSRNVNGNPVTDWLMGGLNCQIEHHLFPNMPRANLRHAQGAVRAYCQHVGVPYLSTGIVDSYAKDCATCTKSASNYATRPPSRQQPLKPHERAAQQPRRSTRPRSTPTGSPSAAGSRECVGARCLASRMAYRL
jgi:hypothetical protein